VADEQHLAKLREGVQAWNKWREENPGVWLDLIGASLSNTYLFGANLSGANLSGANLISANLSNANLSNANLSNANLNDADFSSANLSSANFSSANLSSADLHLANLHLANLHLANLFGTNLSGANLISARVDETTIIKDKWRLVWEIVSQGVRDRNLSDADLSDANLSRADFSRADFSRADFSRANLSGAKLSGAKLSNAKLSNAKLSNAKLNSSDFSGADLRYANLSGANLSDADLSSANLSGANLSDADLSSANFSNANLSRANLNDADFSRANFSNANLSRANLNDADFSRANLSDADLSDADLSNANLSNADLSSANLRGSDLSRANLNGAYLSGASLRGARVDKTTIIEEKWRLVWEIVNQGVRDRNLSSADLSGVNLNGANLSGANLNGANLSFIKAIATSLLGSNLNSATLTGACIQDWNINSATQLENVICEYVYLKGEWSEQEKEYILSDRRPSDPNAIFAPGEFTKLFQKALETVDLIFRNGVDWEALSISLNKLRIEAEGAELSVQAIENKEDGTFVVRINTPPNADKAEIEKYLKQEYEVTEKQLRAQYQNQLQLKDVEIEGYQRENTNLLNIVNLLGNRPINAIALSMSESMGNQYTNNLQGSNIANFANELRDNASQTASQFSQTLGQNADEIVRLITALRDQAQQFPEAQRDNAHGALDDLEEDLSTPEKRQPNRLKRRIVALLTLAGILSTPIATATDFTNNVLELADKFGIPSSELIQHIPPQLLPPSGQR
jgi:uncharacterized protein YjbI with pentapeptide repeats